MSMLFKRIKDWAVSITSFRTGDVIAVDGPIGTAKIGYSDLAKEVIKDSANNTDATEADLVAGSKIPIMTAAGPKSLPGNTIAKASEQTALTTYAQNVAASVAPPFDPTKPNDAGGYAYYAGTPVMYDGSCYVFVQNKSSGAWDESYVEKKPLSECVQLEGIGEAVNEWLNEHPEATTTVLDGSLGETKFSDNLKLQTIKDYVTPEMFGAKGDGVTDDTNAFTAMIAASNKYLLTKRYVVSGIFINKTFSMIGLPGNSLIAKSNEQEVILRLDSGRNNCIVGVNFNGKGDSALDGRGDVVGILLNAASTAEFLMERCAFNFCKIGLFAPKTFWHSRLSLCRFNGCGTGISIGYATSPANQTYLELLFSQIYCNQCDLHIYLEFGTNITFSDCSFGSESVSVGSMFFKNKYPISNLVFRSCNFEGILVKDGSGAFYIGSTFVGTFEDCYFHVVSPVQDVSPSNVSLFYFIMAGNNKITFTGCRFASISIDYVFNCPTSTQERFYLDYSTIQSISGSFSRKFDAKNVFSNSVHIFTISNIPSLSNVPDVPPWNGNLNAYFRGVVIHISKTTDFYMWNGSAWIKLIYVPQPASDGNTYTLKNVAGVLTWVQDS